MFVSNMVDGLLFWSEKQEVLTVWQDFTSAMFLFCYVMMTDIAYVDRLRVVSFLVVIKRFYICSCKGVAIIVRYNALQAS